MAFRVGLFNIGAEGQLYMGAVAAAGVALALAGQGVGRADHRDGHRQVPSGVPPGRSIPGFLRAFANTNEIITSLMLNYVAALFLNYLIFDTVSYWRDTSSPGAEQFPQGKALPDAASVADVRPRHEPRRSRSGWSSRGVLAVAVSVLYKRTRFGFEAAVIGDSPRAARYAGMRTRRSILLVMGLSGLLAGVGGASQDGDFRHLLDPRGLQQPGYGYTGIVVAALARYNPFAVVLVAFLIGGLSNAGYALQGVDFPAGLVGMMQGIILFCALGGELLIRYRVRFGGAHGSVEAATERMNNSLLVLIASSAVVYGTPLLYAALGELLAERSGVLNLGVEGMMLVGAAMGFFVVQRLDAPGPLALSAAIAVVGPRRRRGRERFTRSS